MLFTCHICAGLNTHTFCVCATCIRGCKENEKNAIIPYPCDNNNIIHVTDIIYARRIFCAEIFFFFCVHTVKILRKLSRIKVVLAVQRAFTTTQLSLSLSFSSGLGSKNTKIYRVMGSI